MKTALLSLATVLALFSAGCSRPAKFSAMLDGGFDPEAAFRQHGFILTTGSHGDSFQMPECKYAYKSWCGIIADSEKQASCEAIAQVISGEYNRTMGHPFDQMCVGSGQRTKDQPLIGDLIYKQAGVRGQMLVWLMPQTTNATVSYVIFVREDRLK